MSKASQTAQDNLASALPPVLAKYREHVKHLRPGQVRLIYPWHTPEDIVMAAAEALRQEGWLVERVAYRGNTANYPGTYFLRVQAPGNQKKESFWRWLFRCRLCQLFR